MGMRPATDFSSTAAPLVDRLVGTVFPDVKRVAENTDAIQYVAYNMEAVVQAATALAELPTAAASLEDALAAKVAAEISQTAAAASATAAGTSAAAAAASLAAFSAVGFVPVTVAFGVVADNSTDDTAAMQAALNSGKSLLLPDAVIRLTGSLSTSSSGQKVMGTGAASAGSELRFVNGTADCITIGSMAAATTGVNWSHIRISGATKTGNGAVIKMYRCAHAKFDQIYVASVPRGIHVQSCNNVIFEDCVIAGLTGTLSNDDYGFYLTGDDTYTCNVIVFRNSQTSPDNSSRDDRPTGILCDGAVGTVQVVHCGNTRMGRGMWIRNTLGGTVGPNVFECYSWEADFPEREALRIDAGTGFQMTDFYAHGSTEEYGVYLADGVQNVSFKGGWITGHYKGGVYQAAQEVAFSGITIARNNVGAGGFSGVEIQATAVSTLFTGVRIGRRNGLTGLQLYGVTVASGAQRTYLVGCDLAGNATGALSNSASANQVKLRGCSDVADNTDAITMDGTTLLTISNAQGIAAKFGSTTGTLVNWPRITGGATGSGARMLAEGSDTNIDIVFIPKGTGRVAFGTLTANADAAITGYIEIKDSGGTVRKLAVIS